MEHGSGAAKVSHVTPTWEPDVLGGYWQRTRPLGPDPDREGEIFTTLVRRGAAARARHAVLVVHGFTDYFFHTELADHFAERGFAFYALDLHKCGRSWRDGQSPHFTTDLRRYDTELDWALDVIAEEAHGPSILVYGHSAGGLIVPLWLDRRARRSRPAGDIQTPSRPAGDIQTPNRPAGDIQTPNRPAGDIQTPNRPAGDIQTPNRPAGDIQTRSGDVTGLVLNSPWFELPGPAIVRNAGAAAILAAMAQLRSKLVIPLPREGAYGASLHRDYGGEFDYNLQWKPVGGFPVTSGWINAIRRGQARLHRGLDVGLPNLILRSDHSIPGRSDIESAQRGDAVLDVRHIARWSGCVGNRTTIVPIHDAKHDVFLSLPEPRQQAFRELGAWLDWYTTSLQTRAGAGPLR
jgi:alpha-beta hydrolase superfamily lysophospholipase